MYINSYSEHSDTIQILHKERQISTQVVVSKKGKVPWGCQTAPAAGGAPKVKLPVGNKLLQQQELAIIAI